MAASTGAAVVIIVAAVGTGRITGMVFFLKPEPAIEATGHL
jgi:hypothetical protein